jgi:hypothetical protein
METTAKRVLTLEERADTFEAEILHLKSVIEAIYKQNVKLVKQLREHRAKGSTT